MEPATAVEAITAADAYLAGWFRGHADVKDAADLETARIKASEHLREYGWQCKTCPCLKFLQVVPQVEESLLEILKDPVFQNSETLKKWMEQQLRQALKLKVGSDDFKTETLQSEHHPPGIVYKGTFSSMMAVIFARALPCDEVTTSPFAKETSEQVYYRVKQLGSNYSTIAKHLRDDGIDGTFLARHDIKEFLVKEYKVEREIQQEVLLNLFEKYKPSKIPSVAIGVAACSAELYHEHGGWFGGLFGSSGPTLSHEDLKVRSQKMMAYQSAQSLVTTFEASHHLLAIQDKEPLEATPDSQAQLDN